MCVDASMSGTLKRIQKPTGANANGRIFMICRRLLPVWVMAFGVAACLAAEPSFPGVGLRDGESLTYSVRWGFIPAIGKIVISAQKVGEGDSAILRVTTTTSTWGIARGLFAFDGRGVSEYNAVTGLLMSNSEWSAYRDKVVKDSITFDYAKSTAHFIDYISPEKTHDVPMPAGNPSDLINALIQTRGWTIAPGQQRDSLVIFKDDFYQLTIHADDAEYAWTVFGVFKTLPLIPRMEKTAPKGMFKRGSTVKVWIETEDTRRLPVRFEVGFGFGSGTASLTDYTPPK
jgi:hypothetical protein